MVDAALDALGLAYTFDIAVQEHLAAGRHLQVLERYCSMHPGFYIY
jgi:DNA-binding transcriptional LysR family regulator